MTREEMIRLLVLDRLEHSDDVARYLRLEKVLENGFRGFRNMSDKELATEIRVLGLAAGEVPPDDDFDDAAFDSSLGAGHGYYLGSSQKTENKAR